MRLRSIAHAAFEVEAQDLAAGAHVKTVAVDTYHLRIRCHALVMQVAAIAQQPCMIAVDLRDDLAFMFSERISGGARRPRG